MRLIYRPVRRVGRFLAWVFPALGKLLKPAGEARVLVVYDTSSQPFSLGDMLIFQEASLVLSQEHQVETVDFAIVYNPKRPAASDPVFASINEGNAMYHLASILPIAQVNQRLGSLFVFNSHEHIQRFIGDNSDRYHVWPSGWKVATREYLSPIIFNNLLYRHFKQHGSIPHLTCRPFLKDWAESFFSEHARSAVPVTVNIRNNKEFHLHRNSQLDCWLEFFRYCETRYPAKFIVICARSEIDERLRECSNVVIAKDHQTGVEQDMALIHTSAMHLGAGSGPATMAWFNSKPYLMVNTIYKEGEFFEQPGMIRQEEEGIQRFWFAGPLQRVANGAETTELLIREFIRMWEAVDLQHWQTPANVEARTVGKLQSWLR